MENEVKKERIWELDAFRGICIVGVIIVHTVYDMTSIFGFNIKLPKIYDIIKNYGGILFILLSGICVTLGSKSVKRGITVLSFGFVISAIMAFLTYLSPESFGNVYFGILHLLGVCMLIYPLFKRLPPIWLLIIGIMSIGLGYYFKGLQTDTLTPLVSLGIRSKGFYAVDHFPLFPNLGYFLIGAFLGKTVYKNKVSLIPRFPHDNALCLFFTLCGKHSLWIYLLHQPMVYGSLWLYLQL